LEIRGWVRRWVGAEGKLSLLLFAPHVPTIPRPAHPDRRTKFPRIYPIRTLSPRSSVKPAEPWNGCFRFSRHRRSDASTIRGSRRPGRETAGARERVGGARPTSNTTRPSCPPWSTSVTARIAARATRFETRPTCPAGSRDVGRGVHTGRMIRRFRSSADADRRRAFCRARRPTANEIAAARGVAAASIRSGGWCAPWTIAGRPARTVDEGKPPPNARLRRDARRATACRPRGSMGGSAVVSVRSSDGRGGQFEIGASSH